MGILRREVPSHYIPIHPDNIAKKDWIILLEAGNIVESAARKLRVALATTEKRIVRKYNLFLRAEHFLVLDVTHASMLYTFARSSTATILTESSLRWMVRRSEACWPNRFTTASSKKSPGTSRQRSCPMRRSFRKR